MRAKVIRKLCESLIGQGFSGKPKAEVMRTKPFKDRSDLKDHQWVSDTIILEKEDQVSQQAMERIKMQLRDLFDRKNASPLCHALNYEIRYTTDLSHLVDMIYDKHLDWEFVK